MVESLEKRRILYFTVFSFGFSWLIGLLIYTNGGLTGQTALSTFAAPNMLLLLVYMYGPTIGNVLTRYITDEGRQNLWIKASKSNWKELLTAWTAPTILTIVGAATYFLMFPSAFDPGLEFATQLLQQMGQELPFDTETFLALQFAQALLLAPIVNSLFTFGEEFGWRAYLLPKLRPLGDRKALIITGIVWGVWHWPIIFMGYNYEMAGQFLPLLAMTWFTVVLGIFLGWLTLRTENVWPAVIGHAAINGVAGIGVLAANQQEVNLLLGPASTGVVASLPWVFLAIWILWKIEQ